MSEAAASTRLIDLGLFQVTPEEGADCVNMLCNDAKELVKKSPGVAVGLAAVAGFFLARLFKGKSSNSED